MYPNYAPDLKLEETISSPFDPAVVYGFQARNATLGRHAVVLKEEAVTTVRGDKVVAVPQDVADQATGELVILLEDEVLAIDAVDFGVEYTLNTIERDGEKVTMPSIRIDNGHFRRFDEKQTQVGN